MVIVSENVSYFIGQQDAACIIAYRLLSIHECRNCCYQGIPPAVGYPRASCWDALKVSQYNNSLPENREPQAAALARGSSLARRTMVLGLAPCVVGHFLHCCVLGVEVVAETEFLIEPGSSTAPRRGTGDLPSLPLHAPTIPLVKLCYTLVHAAEAVGIRDLADGEFLPTDRTLEQGIERQLNYLLDQVGCVQPGFRLLEIGCGYGHLLRLAKERGAEAVGVNISPEQVHHCQRQDLRVFCCSYRNLLDAEDWHGRFDGVIANGSLEHWVQPEDVQQGRMDDIYRESFAIVHRLLDPSVPNARYVTTAIHVLRDVRPEYLLTPWRQQPRGTDRRHFSLLHQWMGGYYPVPGQLAACATPYFELLTEMDGSQGYKTANDIRLRRMFRGLYTSPKMLWRIARACIRHPRVTRTMIQSYFLEQSWDWQFRGDHPPMQLLRHTWMRK